MNSETGIPATEQNQGVSYLERLKEATEYYDRWKDHGMESRQIVLLEAAKAYATLLESQDYQIVPVEPTEHQLYVVNKAFNLSPEDNNSTEYAYKALIRAAPPYNPENSK